MIRFPFRKPKDAPSAGTESERALDDAFEAAEQARVDPEAAAGEAPLLQDDPAPGDSAQENADQENADQEDADQEDPSEIESLSLADDPEAEAPAPYTGAPDGAPMEEQIRMVEAMLFASDKPLSTAELASRMPIGCDAAVAVRRLEDMYRGRGVALARIAGKWAFRTAPDLAHLLTGEAVEQRKLSRAAVETLAIVAYHQPVTRAEIEDIRQVGVSKGTLDLLMELEWIKLGRRRQTPGRPVTFVTTDAFLEHFGLESLKDLPRLEELRQSGLLETAPPLGFAPKSEDDDDAFDGDSGEDVGEDEDGRQQDLLV